MPKFKKVFFFPVFLAVMMWPDALSAQQTIVLQKISGPIKLDGLSDEPAWQTIDPLPMSMYTPVFEGPATEKTEIRIAYDDQYLYVSGRLYDSDPDGIQANSLIRDLDRGGDFLNVMFDTFNDNENYLGFTTTPAGNRLDAEISNDAEGDAGEFFNMDWNTYWDNAVVQNDEGWFVEMRIPFSSLRFQSTDGKVVFGFSTNRLVGRKNERVTFPAIPPKWDLGPWKASRGVDLILYDVKPARPIYLTPYLLGGFAKNARLNSDATGYVSKNDFEREVGLDAKFVVSSNLTVDLTANTDFAQVESDDERVNLTRFSLFFDEKRQFFQERSGIFRFSTGGNNRLFHSRRIGLTDDGRPVRIFGGGRVVGRIGDWDYGLLNMQTDGIDTVSSENFGVIRLRRRWLNDYSFFGAMVTTKAGDDRHNVSYGLDASIRVMENDYITVNWAQTTETDSKTDFDASLIRLEWERRKTRGLGFAGEFIHTGRRYNPEVGFVDRTGVLTFSNEVTYGFFASDDSRVRKQTAGIADFLVLNKSNNHVETDILTGHWQVETKTGATVTLEVNRQFEDIPTPFNLSDEVEIPEDRYTFYDFAAQFNMAPGRLLRSNFAASAGSFFDGTKIGASVSPVWNQSRHLEISGNYEFNRIRFSDRNDELDTHILRFRLQGAFNSEFSGNALVQFNSVVKDIAVNARLRYNFREGQDLYIVYNEILNTDRDFGPVRLPASDNRTILIKYTHTFIR